MARNVASDDATVESIAKPGAQIHEYQPTPGDIQRAPGAKLIFSNNLWPPDYPMFLRPRALFKGLT